MICVQDAQHEAMESVLDYLLTCKEDSVSLLDVQEATLLNQTTVLQVLSQLGAEGKIVYKLNPSDRGVRALIRELEGEVTDNYIEAYLDSE